VTDSAPDHQPELRRITSWDDVLDLWGRGTRSTSDDTVGRWALAVLRRELGEGWVADCERTGWLPPEILRGGTSLDAFGMLVELAAALHRFRDAHGFGRVRNMLKKNPTPERLASTRCALRLAAAATAAGVTAEVELGKPPVDLRLRADDIEVGVEIKSLLRLERLTRVNGWLSELYDLLPSTFRAGDLRLDGAATAALEPKATADLARRIEDAGRLVRAGLHAPVMHSGGNWFEVTRPGLGQRPGTHVALPQVNLSAKLEARLQKVIDQAQRSGVTWALIDSQDDLWHQTPWSQQAFIGQVDQLAAYLRDRVAGESQLDGVIVTDGGVVLDLDSADATAEASTGAVGLHRRLDRGRIRKTIIVTLSAEGAAAVPLWRRVLDAEPGWIAAALRAECLPYPALLST
jgi:hypothetical protein